MAPSGQPRTGRSKTTSRFDDPAYDDAGYARAVAERYGTHHTEEVVRLDATEMLPPDDVLSAWDGDARPDGRLPSARSDALSSGPVRRQSVVGPMRCAIAPEMLA